MHSRYLVGAVGASKHGSFSVALTHGEHVDTALRKAQNVGGLEGDVVLASGARGIKQLFKTLSVTIAGVEQQQRVKIVSLLEALLGKLKESTQQGDVSDLLPLFYALLILSYLEGGLRFIEGDGQVELVVHVRRDLEGPRFLVVGF